MKRFTLSVVALVVGAWLLIPAAGSAIPFDCYCPYGSGTTLWNTTWGGAPTYTCSDLAAIGHSSSYNYAASQCTYGVCSITYSNEVCVDPGLATQHWDLVFTYKCYICPNGPE